jgi:hypothetical protein
VRLVFFITRSVYQTERKVFNLTDGPKNGGHFRSHRYVIHFDEGAEPKVKAFWSITMYNLKYNLVANPINRYSVGDRSGMKRDADGGLTIYVQKSSPGADKERNWLPAPEGLFFLFLRTYLPGDDILNQTWRPPKISRIE